MTSGNFEQYSVTSIWLNRETRQRKVLRKVDELALSINKSGLINPITIKNDGELIAGERRYEAVKLLGWDKVSVQFVETLDEFSLQLIELDENIKRVDIEWQDEVDAVTKYHKIRTEQEGKDNWNNKKTAEELGLSETNFSGKLLVGQAIIQENKQIITAPKYSVALNLAKRSEERKRAAILETVNELTDVTDIPDDLKEAAQLDEYALEKVVPLQHADFTEWQQDYSDPRFNFIHCDFPYGVNADKHHQGAAAKMGGYEDDFNTYRNLLHTLGYAMDNVVADSAHLMFWFSMDYYQTTLNLLTDAGWTVNPFPLMWHKSDNAGILPDPARGPRRTYETAFLASRGDRKIVRAVANSHSAPTTKHIHMSEKPQGMLKHFFRMFVDEHTVMLDPTCGSANAVKVAEDMGAGTVLGLEKDESFYYLAKGQWDE